MNLRTSLLLFLAPALAAALVFHLFQRQLSRAWFAFGVHPDVVAAVERSVEDQKRLARLDPASEAEYRRQFEKSRRLLGRLRVLELSRGEIVGRYEVISLGAVAALALVAGSGYAWHQRRETVRLARLQAALGELAAGRPDVRLGESRHDLIGRIAAMIERASARMAGDRRRLASLENLASWQEAARRHAHEIRTPLTAARLELARCDPLVAAAAADESSRQELRRLHESLGQELDRLAAFTRRYTSFARLPRPAPAAHDLVAVLAEFVDLFASAWPELTVRFTPPAEPVAAWVDPEMLRQVLVNLVDNSAHALREQGRTDGTVELTIAGGSDDGSGVALEIRDDGPGIAPALRAGLFEPYTTSRSIGEGMGLGLAIARKILLDHGGDLELLADAPPGATFRVVLRSVSTASGDLAALTGAAS